MWCSLCILVLHFTAANARIGLEVDWSADSSQVETRALLVRLKVGSPQREVQLVPHMASGAIELDSCLRHTSRTNNNNGSDIVLLGQEHVLGTQSDVALVRTQIVDHCDTIGALPPLFYENCAGAEHCHGILGLDRRSFMWRHFSSLRVSLSHIALSENTPRGDAQRFACAPNRRSLCLLHGVEVSTKDKSPLATVSVLFHFENSYTYVPRRLLLAMRALNEPVRFFQPATRAQFALHPSAFRFAPGSWSSHTASDVSSAPPPAYASSVPTSLLRAWNRSDQISIGNGALRQLTLHYEPRARTLHVQQFWRREHLGWVELATGLSLVFLQARSVTLSFNELGWLSAGLPIQCACQATHEVRTGGVLHWCIAILTCAMALLAAVQVAHYLAASVDRAVTVAACCIFFFNLCAHITLLTRRRLWFRDAHCYDKRDIARQFARVYAVSCIVETLIALAIIAVSLVTRQGTLATPLSVLATLAAIVNSFRYLWYWAVRGAGAWLIALVNAVALPLVLLAHLDANWFGDALNICIVALLCAAVGFYLPREQERVRLVFVAKKGKSARHLSAHNCER